MSLPINEEDAAADMAAAFQEDAASYAANQIGALMSLKCLSHNDVMRIVTSLSFVDDSDRKMVIHTLSHDMLEAAVNARDAEPPSQKDQAIEIAIKNNHSMQAWLLPSGPSSPWSAAARCGACGALLVCKKDGTIDGRATTERCKARL